MKHKLLFSAVAIMAMMFIFVACNSENKKTDQETTTTGDTATNRSTGSTDQGEVHGTEVKPGDVQMTKPLNAEWVTSGKGIYDVKCQSCHKLNEERLVGPGWKNITTRREPHWIMNMITNVDMMLETDPEAQKLLEQCLVRMPNQNVSKDDARKLLEFMRSNDGEK